MANLRLKLISRIAMASFLALLFGAQAQAWWNNEWTGRRKIVIDASDTGVSIPEPIDGAVPVLLRLSDSNFSFDQAKEDGTDLRFVAADDKTPLPYHIESWDLTFGAAFVWVRVPDLKPGSKVSLFVYYGNTGPKAVRVDDPKGTYDADTVLVYHFAEHNAPATDSSGKGNNAAKAGVPDDGALIGTGIRTLGKDAITVDKNPTLAWTDAGSLTWSVWLKPATDTQTSILFNRTDNGKNFTVGLDSGVPYVDVAGTKATGGAAITKDAWKHLAVVVEPGKVTLYVDGAVSGTPANATLAAMDSPLYIGASGEENASTPGFTGELDELVISKTARSAGYIHFLAAEQNDTQGKMVVFAAPEQTGGNPLNAGYFGIIIKNLTPDGWAVICLLMVMAAISWFVMITKASYLNKVTKANKLFIKEWEHVANDLTAIDESDEHAKSLGGRVSKQAQRTIKDASVYKIYHVGVEEIRRRLNANGEEGGDRMLSPNSIPAIRASLDGSLVRETQKLNSLMVLLTIAISGGPFLGLLGTVVGVMITFAAIAAAGDVNVNSIAPGIAAALLATVAGLAVAIPALFGYNYLLARVKNATSDMHVFIDEFITKIAEFYCDCA